MPSITEIIRPIELLRGTHPEAGDTGRGCLMNVVSYLNGDRKITDKPACSCPVIIPIAIHLNDFMTDAERAQLLPYVLRISGSRTDDIDVMVNRAWACVRFPEWCRDEAAASVASAARAARAESVASAASAARAESVARAAMAAMAASAARAERAAMAAWVASAESSYQAYRQRAITRCLALLDKMLAMTEVPVETPALIERAERYVALSVS